MKYIIDFIKNGEVFPGKEGPMGFLNHISSHFHKDEPAYMPEEERAGRIDDGALAILRALEEEGKEAYVVGGCVRDLFMGRIPNDWDITTSARPSETMAVARSHGWKAVDGGGRRFGTVIIVLSGNTYEVTTFRKEFYGADSHRPEQVTFSDTLEEDVSRRDFTVNAMALDRRGNLYDYFHGLDDLKHKKLRTVGKASERFQEDALRLFRACRFLGQLDFMAEKSLVEGMKEAYPRVAGLSLERVREEIDKLIVAPHAARGFDLMVRMGLNETSCRLKVNGTYKEIPILPELSHLVGLPQQKEFHKFDSWYHTLAVLEASKPLLINRWAALLHDVGKGMPGVRAIRNGKYTDYGHDIKGAEMAEAILKRWERPARFTNHVVWLVANHMKFHYFANFEEANGVKWVRTLAREKAFPSSKELAEAFVEMTDLGNADIIGCGRPLSATEGHSAFGKYMEDLALSIPVSSHELHYDKEVPKVLGSHVSDGMANLLLRVQNGELENTPEALYNAAVRYVRRRS